MGSPPASMKAMVPFLKRAEELDRDTSRGESRLIAYYCRLYAVGLGIKVGDQSPQGKAFLLQLLSKCEAEKATMSGFSSDEAKMVVTSFANDVFKRADDEDRAGLADKGTARTFYNAGNFYDVLEQFGSVEEEVQTRRKYAKWKAAEILKAIKEGRQPMPGAHGEDAPDPFANIPDMPADAGPPGGPAATAEANILKDIIPAAPTAAPAAAYDANAPAQAPAGQQQYTIMDIPEPRSVPDSHLGGGSGGGGGGGGGSRDYQRPADSSSAYSRVDLSPPPSAKPVAPAPKPAPLPAAVNPRPAPAPAPAAPHTGIGAAIGGLLGGSGGGGGRRGRASQEAMNDALELCKFAISALEHRDPELAVQRLENALRVLR